ncbi:MAG TPA: DUF2459 domain-containing protein [Terriglobales bacterium]|nr:DUF2459 domain-containing protein [Terriglobales bacterium]
MPCRSVFIVHNSWHAAIVLRKEDLTDAPLPELADFPNVRFIEFSWGDKDYFPDPNAGFLMALKAAFWSSGSVLHLVGFTENIDSFYPEAKHTELRLSDRAYARLTDYLSRSFDRRHANGRAPASPGLLTYSRFYPSTEKFSWRKTCNTWVAAALEFAGVPVSPGLVLTAAQLAEQLDEIGKHHRAEASRIYP